MEQNQNNENLQMNSSQKPVRNSEPREANKTIEDTPAPGEEAAP